MDVCVLLIKCSVIFHITLLRTPPAESGVRLTAGWREQAERRSTLHPPAPPAPPAESGVRLTAWWREQADISSNLHPAAPPAGTEIQTSAPPEDAEEGNTQRADVRPVHGDSRRRKKNRRSRGRPFGQFNSDTFGCSGIELWSCSSSSHCSGCLGLFTCDRILSSCQLKAVSGQTDTFLQTLNEV